MTVQRQRDVTEQRGVVVVTPLPALPSTTSSTCSSHRRIFPPTQVRLRERRIRLDGCSADGGDEHVRHPSGGEVQGDEGALAARDCCRS